MEKYYGLTDSTIRQMMSDFADMLKLTIGESNQFPNDLTLWERVERLSSTITELSNELHNRINV